MNRRGVNVFNPKLPFEIKNILNSSEQNILILYFKDFSAYRFSDYSLNIVNKLPSISKLETLIIKNYKL